MHRFSAPLLIGLFVLALVPSGCQGRLGGGDGNTNDNSGGGDDLTPAQKQAVDAVVEQLEAATRGLMATVDGLEGLDLTADGSVGQCPAVTTVRETGVVGVTADYGTGCTNAFYGDDMLSGLLFVTYNLVTQAVAISYDQFTIDGITINGAFILQLTRDEDTGRILSGQIELTSSGVGSAAGEINLQFNLRGDAITILTADLTLTETGGEPYTVHIEGLVIRPISNGNFVPESGTMTFELPAAGPGTETVTVVLTFDDSSPVDRTISVTVGAADPVEYEIPGV